MMPRALREDDRDESGRAAEIGPKQTKNWWVSQSEPWRGNELSYEFTHNFAVTTL